MDHAVQLSLDGGDTADQSQDRSHTGKGIAGNLRQHYPKWLLQGIVALLFLANMINIGADLGAMADALGMLIDGPTMIYVVVFGSLSAINPIKAL